MEHGRGNQSVLETPVVKYFDWSSEHKCFNYYDKELEWTNDKGEVMKGKKVNVDLPFTFLVLDELSTIKGYHKTQSMGIYSNEVRDLQKQELTVKTKNGVIAKGLYAAIKDTLVAAGAKYTKSIYIAYKENNELVIGHIKLSGAAAGAWMEFTKNNRVFNIAITVKGTVQGKNGAVIYNMPMFMAKPVDKDTDIKAIELNKKVQAYLAEYFKRKTEESATEDTTVNNANDIEATAQAHIEKETRASMPTTTSIPENWSENIDEDSEIPF